MESSTQIYTPVKGGFQIENGSAEYVRPIYAPHMHDAPGNLRYIYYLGDRPKLVLSDADSGHTAENSRIKAYMNRYAHLFLGILNGNKSKWLDEMEHIVSRYICGHEEYEISDPSFAGDIKLVFCRSNRIDGMCVKVMLPQELSDKLVVAVAGQNGKKGAQPVGGCSDFLMFQAADTEDTAVYVEEKYFRIADNIIPVIGTTDISMNYAIKDARKYQEGVLALSDSGNEGFPMVMGTSEGNRKKEIYILLSTEPASHRCFKEFDRLAEGLFDSAVEYYRSLSETVQVETPDASLDAAVAAQMVALDASWDAPTVCHGCAFCRLEVCLRLCGCRMGRAY